MVDWSNKQEVLEQVKKQGFFLKNASDKLKDDYDVVLAAVKEDGKSLQFASDRLKNDFNIVLAAVKEDGLSIQYAPDLSNNQDIVIEAILEDSNIGGESLYGELISPSIYNNETLWQETLDIVTF